MCCFFRYCRCLELENCPPREILCLPLAQFLGILPIQHTFCWGGGRQHTAAYRSPRPGIKFLPPQQGQHWLLNLLSREGTPTLAIFLEGFLSSCTKYSKSLVAKSSDREPELDFWLRESLLCDLRQFAQPLCASVFSSVKWGQPLRTS